ncbi:hypothetical protein BJ508DRAFT_302781 [Ascobolus immersus RN42]|uniref:Uncharacterized protein n=1 Tax=Ascobolus immersus RN42 TaxID=1160509 RepID=A0A3N4IJB1_ASCIM|nr:hypothetical protein BJ508DRAFT_302781 [Ascobolus immersus RN42]
MLTGNGEKGANEGDKAKSFCQQFSPMARPSLSKNETARAKFRTETFCPFQCPPPSYARKPHPNRSGATHQQRTNNELPEQRYPSIFTSITSKTLEKGSYAVSGSRTRTGLSSRISTNKTAEEAAAIEHRQAASRARRIVVQPCCSKKMDRHPGSMNKLLVGCVPNEAIPTVPDSATDVLGASSAITILSSSIRSRCVLQNNQERLSIRLMYKFWWKSLARKGVEPKLGSTTQIRSQIFQSRHYGRKRIMPRVHEGATHRKSSDH